MDLETDGVKFAHKSQEVKYTIFKDNQVVFLSYGVYFLPPF